MENQRHCQLCRKIDTLNFSVYFISRNVIPVFDMAIQFILMQCGCAKETNQQLILA